MNHIIAIRNKISIEYVIISDIKELAMIGVVAGKGTAFAPPTEIVGSRVEMVPLGPSCDESFIDWGEGSTSLSFFDTNWFLRDLFSSINFNRSEDRISISCLNILFDNS